MDMYSGAGLDKFDPEDIKGALIDVKKVAKDLLNSYSNLKDLFGVIENKKDMEEYEQYLENEEIRNEFYEKLSIFSRALKIVLGSVEATDEVGEERIDKYKSEFKFFQNIRASVKLRYSDSIDFKEYQGEMKNLIDTYVNANDLVEIVEPVNVMEVERFQKELDKLPTKKAKADMIRTRIGKSLQDIKLSDPLRYKKFSELLKESYEKYKEKRLAESEQLKIEELDREYLNNMTGIKDEYQKGKEVKNYPESIKDNKDVQVIYDLMDEFKKESNLTNQLEFETDFNKSMEKTSIKIDEIIQVKKKPEWGTNTDNVNEVLVLVIYQIKKMLENNDIKIDIEKIKKIALDIISVAKERYKFE
jgi:type I restriction enzyme R subunit